MSDRIEQICGLLLGAAYADNQFRDAEKQTIEELLAKLLDGDLTDDLKNRIETFDSSSFDVSATAASFKGDSDDEKHKLLELIAAVHDADAEYELAEDEYMRAVATTLGVDDEMLSEFTLEIEIEDLKTGLKKLRTPPPIPGS